MQPEIELAIWERARERCAEAEAQFLRVDTRLNRWLRPGRIHAAREDRRFWRLREHDAFGDYLATLPPIVAWKVLHAQKVPVALCPSREHGSVSARDAISMACRPRGHGCGSGARSAAGGSRCTRGHVLGAAR